MCDRKEVQTGNNHTTVIIYTIFVLFIYLILCALYESRFVHLAVIRSVPFGRVGSFLSVKSGVLKYYLSTGWID